MTYGSRPCLPALQSAFNDIYGRIGALLGKHTPVLQTTGGVEFIVEAKVAKDGRRFISLPHNNRIYEVDWGYSSNTMGKDGQRIGHYSVPLDRWIRGTRE